MKCVGDAGCTDNTSCYLIPGAPCTTVVDQYGNGSVAAAIPQLIQTCGKNNGCPTR
jgi:hypothetical protein